MIEYKVMISQAADADLEEIADYIAINLKEPFTALKQMGRIQDAMMSLETMPERHGIVADQYLSSKGIRLMPVDHYLVFYTVNKAAEMVGIVRVLHGRREWEALL